MQEKHRLSMNAHIHMLTKDVYKCVCVRACGCVGVCNKDMYGIYFMRRAAAPQQHWARDKVRGVAT